jgi:hypothetical protein
MLHTPVLLLIFNRPETTRKIFEVIRKVKPKKLFIAADGPRKDRVGEHEVCATTRAIVVNGIDWDCEVQTLMRDDNLGCGIAPAEAISWFFSQVEEGIILEDDCLASESFFVFCEELLGRYAQNEEVMHISGNNFQFGKKWGEGSYYFSHYVNAWGWATWRRAWEHYDFMMKSYSEETIDDILKKNLSTKTERKFWKSHFEQVKNGKRKDIWDYQWVYAIWKQNGLTIIPNTNLVSNIGFDSNATHTFDKLSKVANNPSYELREIEHPLKIRTSFKADRRLFKICHKPPLTLRDRAYLAKEKIKKSLKIPVF